MSKKKLNLSTTHIILLSFLVAIFVGALLLCLPISSASGEWTPFVDALFTSTTATCVTGLVVIPTVSSWSLFGQVVILILIQMGGLGIITVMSGLAVIFHRKMGLADRLLIQDAFNLNTLSGLVRFVKKVIAGTLIVEGAGALLYMTVFVRQFGLKGICLLQRRYRYYRSGQHVQLCHQPHYKRHNLLADYNRRYWLHRVVGCHQDNKTASAQQNKSLARLNPAQ